MILFFDTETTGFFKDHLPVDDESQPYLVQLAAQLCEDNGDIIGSFSLIVDPATSDGWQGSINVVIPEAASNVHGITNETVTRLGVRLGLALSMFSHFYHRADLICAHNVAFDRSIMEVAIARNYGKARVLSKPSFCTMVESTPILNLPPTDRMIKAGFNKPKPPKLDECMSHFFNESANGHDAMADVIACRRIYFHLKKELTA